MNTSTQSWATKGASLFVSYNAEEILTRYLDPEKSYGGTIQFSIGPMKEQVRMLRFDEDFRNELDDRWAKVVATTRISTTALGFGALISLIAIAFWLLQNGHCDQRLLHVALAVWGRNSDTDRDRGRCTAGPLDTLALGISFRS